MGLFGGTFDPPHEGHVSVARDVADALRLERVMWITAAVAPHKVGSGVSPASSRLAMVRAAVAADDRFVASSVETARAGVSYTIETLRAIRADVESDVDLFLIIGADQFRVFADWREPEEILKHAWLAVIDRAGQLARDGGSGAPPATGQDGPVLPDEASRTVFVPVERIDISSTQVRDLVRAGEDVSRLVPEGVLRIIQRDRLYRE